MDTAARLLSTGRHPMTERCMAPTGTVWTGNLYCGYQAKTEDANGRPICGVHRRGVHGIAWHGDKGRYPEGTGGSWQFKFGDRK